MDLKQILQDAKTIAVVGCSGRPSRTSFAISRYLIAEGYAVVPVNPNYEEVHGLACYPDLASIPTEPAIDIVNVFRNPRYVLDVVREVVTLMGGLEKAPVVWTQLGVSTPAAAELARVSGIPYVTNRCIMVEHSRYV